MFLKILIKLTFELRNVLFQLFAPLILRLGFSLQVKLMRKGHAGHAGHAGNAILKDANRLIMPMLT